MIFIGRCFLIVWELHISDTQWTGFHQIYCHSFPSNFLLISSHHFLLSALVLPVLAFTGAGVASWRSQPWKELTLCTSQPTASSSSATSGISRYPPHPSQHTDWLGIVQSVTAAMSSCPANTVLIQISTTSASYNLTSSMMIPECSTWGWVPHSHLTAEQLWVSVLSLDLKK